MSEKFSFSDPTSAIEALEPEIAKLYEAEERIVRALAEKAGLEGDMSYQALRPNLGQLKHQHAASACIAFAMRLDACSKAEAVKRVARANPGWFSEDGYWRYTNRLRQEARRLAEGKRRRPKKSGPLRSNA
jgi:hypothetical protein